MSRAYIGVRAERYAPLDTVGVAQLVERQVVALTVVGSSPITHPELGYLPKTDIEMFPDRELHSTPGQ